jgi:polysaccharide transporter, PST family
VGVLKKITSGVARNIYNISAIQAAGALAPIVIWPYLAHKIGLDLFGEIIFCSSVVLYLTAFVEYGFNYTSTKDVSLNVDNKGALQRIFIETFASRLILFFIGFMFLFFLILSWSFFSSLSVLLLLSMVSSFGSAFSTLYFYQGTQNLFLYAIGSLMEKLISTATIVILVDGPGDYLIVPLIYGVSSLVFNLLFFSSIVIKLRPIGCSGAGILSVISRIRSGFDVFINIFSPNFYSNFSVVFLGFISGMNMVSILDGYRKITSVFDHLILAVGRGYFPLVSRNILLHAQANKLILLLASAGAFFIFLLSEVIIHYFVEGVSYELSGIGIVMAIGVLGFGLKVSYAEVFLINIGATRVVRDITLYSSALAMLFSLVLIPVYSVVGAAMSIALGRVFQGILSYRAYRGYV